MREGTCGPSFEARKGAHLRMTIVRAARRFLRPDPIASFSFNRQNGRQPTQENQRRNPMGTSITFKRPDGKENAGYLANAARGNAPGVVVVQEWWGLSENIKGLCDRFAVA